MFLEKLQHLREVSDLGYSTPGTSPILQKWQA